MFKIDLLYGNNFSKSRAEAAKRIGGSSLKNRRFLFWLFPIFKTRRIVAWTNIISLFISIPHHYHLQINIKIHTEFKGTVQWMKKRIPSLFGNRYVIVLIFFSQWKIPTWDYTKRFSNDRTLTIYPRRLFPA